MAKKSVDGVAVTVASAEHLATYTEAQGKVDEFATPRLFKADDPHSRVFYALFDGTSNDAIKDPEHITNVGLLGKQLEVMADANPSIGFYYKEGPGTQGGVRGLVDAATGGTYEERIDAMYKKFALQSELWLAAEPHASISVVSVGFSRGAEQAAGFARMVDERGIEKIVKSGGVRAISNEQLAIQPLRLREPGTVPQALGLYDPVCTGTPARHDRRPPPSVLTGLQIYADHEYRRDFPSTVVIPKGTSENGRFLGVNTAGAHSDIGGGYLLNGLSNRNFNLMACYLNNVMGERMVQPLEVPAAEHQSVIHTTPWYFVKRDEREVIHALERSGAAPRQAVSPVLSQLFARQEVPLAVAVQNVSQRDMKPEGHQLLVITSEARSVDKVVNGSWESARVGSPNGLPKGQYDLTGAEKPGKAGATKLYEGSVLHVDKDKKHVYQLQENDKGKSSLVRHDLALYKEPPAVGSMTKVDYVRGTGQALGREKAQER